MEMMKAAVYHGPHDIRLQEVPKPIYGPEGALIKVKACGICNIIDTNAWENRPEGGRGIGWAMGHEWSGEVEEIGSEVTDVKVGDRVYGSTMEPCYQCEPCRTGDYHRCSTFGGGGHHGAQSEYLSIPLAKDHNVAVFPKEMSFRDIAMSEPMELSVGLAAKAKAGDVAVILGQDLVGIGLVACLKERGVDKIITSELSELRRNAAKDIGADIVVDALKEDVIQVVMDETRGRGADIVVIIENRPIAVQQAMSIVRSAGNIWLTQGRGYLHLNPKVVSINPIHFRQRDAGYVETPIIFDSGLFNMQIAWGTLGPYKPRWLKIIELAKAGIITAEKYVTHVFPLEKITEAYEVAMNPYDSIKVMVEP